MAHYDPAGVHTRTRSRDIMPERVSSDGSADKQLHRKPISGHRTSRSRKGQARSRPRARKLSAKGQSPKTSETQHSQSDPKRSDPRERQSGARTEKSSKRQKAFITVGVGASAGGYEAFSQLLENLSPDTGMAFVLVQHLDPTHESKLTELLS